MCSIPKSTYLPIYQLRLSHSNLPTIHITKAIFSKVQARHGSYMAPIFRNELFKKRGQKMILGGITL